MTYQLPIFKGYTVDARLKEFRREKQSEHFAGLEHVSFGSQRGERLLSAYIKSLDSNTEEFKRITEVVL